MRGSSERQERSAGCVRASKSSMKDMSSKLSRDETLHNATKNIINSINRRSVGL